MRYRNSAGRHVGSDRGSRGAVVIEGLEDRRLCSGTVAGPLFAIGTVGIAAAPAIKLSGVSPGKILAGNTGYETVTVFNRTADSVTENVTVALAPSLDGTTAAGAYGSGGLSETVTINKHGTAKVKVPFVPTDTLAAGSYHTLATVTVGGDVLSGTAPGTYKLTLPPGPTTTPSLVGHYVGLITSTSSQSTGLFGTGTKTRVKQASFIWQTTGQTLTSLTGLFAVGAGQTTGTMPGQELTTGAIQYTLTSDNINYTIKGKVTPDGTKITGTFKGTLVNNIFATLNGTFKLIRQTS